MKWTKKKPKRLKECILLTASWYKDYWHYTLFTIEKVDGYNDKEEPCWYWGILAEDGQEWGDYADLTADLYCVLPTLKKKKENT